MHRDDDLRKLVFHQHDVRRLDGRVAAQAAHRDADVGLRQNRRVVDAIANKRHFVLAFFLRKNLVQERDFLIREQLGVHLVDADFASHFFRHLLAVACQHHEFAHAIVPQQVDGRFRVFLDFVGDLDHSGVASIDAHIHARAKPVAFRQRVDALLRHELLVANAYRLLANDRFHAVAGHFLNVVHIRQ